MSEQVVEKFEGVLKSTNEVIKFKRVWCGHRFTDEECQQLLDGEVISFTAKSAKGNEYTAEGKLEEQEYNGYTYWGFKFNPNKFPEKWSGHTFTEEEKNLLEAGQLIRVDDCVSSKTGKRYATELSWEKDVTGNYKIVPHFNK